VGRYLQLAIGPKRTQGLLEFDPKDMVGKEMVWRDNHLPHKSKLVVCSQIYPASEGSPRINGSDELYVVPAEILPWAIDAGIAVEKVYLYPLGSMNRPTILTS
jgi:hypothetical protein